MSLSLSGMGSAGAGLGGGGARSRNRSRSLSQHAILHGHGHQHAAAAAVPAHALVRRGTWANASGSSAVAIDNKIEQAMDLVKSHLMFAVREEVEVLKDKIAELMERISQLEIENSILKAHATQEALAQLTAASPPATAEPAPTPGTALPEHQDTP